MKKAYPVSNETTVADVSPAISVVMSVYNGQFYLAEAVKSILQQRFQDFEFIIVDDGSADATREILASFKDSRIIILKNHTNIGLTASLNRALNVARGKYIARLDSDDISAPERLQRQYTYLEANQHCAALGSIAYFIDGHGRILHEGRRPLSFEEILASCFFHNPFWHSSVMFRREIALNLGGYDTRFRRAQDYDLWLRMLADGHELRNLPEILVYFRMHESRVTRTDSETAFSCHVEAVQRGLLRILGIRARRNTLAIIHSLRTSSAKNYNVLQRIRVWRLLRRLIQRFQTRFADLEDAQADLGKRIQRLIHSSCSNRYLREHLLWPYVSGISMRRCIINMGRFCIKIVNVKMR